MSKANPSYEWFGLTQRQVRMGIAENTQNAPGITQEVEDGNYGYLITQGHATRGEKLPIAHIPNYRTFSWLKEEYISLKGEAFDEVQATGVYFKIKESLGKYLLLQVPNTEHIFLASLGMMHLELRENSIPLIGPILDQYQKANKLPVTMTSKKAD